MDFTKILAAGLVVLLAAGAVTAAGAGSNGQVVLSDTERVTNADVDTTYENGTVTLTLVDDGGGEGIANATVDVKREYQGDDSARADDEGAYERIGTTDANGTTAFDLTPENASRNVTALEVHFTKGAFSAELEYRVENGSLSLIEEEYEYERAADREDHNDTAQYSDDERLSVSMADARITADTALEEPPQGNWQLVEADAHEADNYYEFEYVLVDADRPGEAEIRVHGSSGDVIEYEQDVERTEQDGEEKTEREDDGDDKDDTEREEDGDDKDDTERKEGGDDKDDTEREEDGNDDTEREEDGDDDTEREEDGNDDTEREDEDDDTEREDEDDDTEREDEDD